MPADIFPLSSGDDEQLRRFRLAVEELANLPVADRTYYLPARAAEIGVTERHLHSAVHKELQARSKRVQAERLEQDRERERQQERRDAEQREIDRIRKEEARERDRAKKAEERQQRRLAKEAEKHAERERQEAKKAALRKAKDKAKALGNISRLPVARHEPELQKLADRLGEDVAALREEFEEFVGVGGGEVSAEKTEPWPEPVDLAVLLQGCSDKIRKHVAIQEHQLTAAVLWDAHAWLYDHDVPTHSPMLAATSAEPDSGKTTLVSVVGRMAPRFSLNIEMTGPSLYRTVDATKPMLVLTEADDLFHRKSDLKSVFNAGWTRGAKVPRQVNVDGVWITAYFDVFTPKAIDLLGHNLPPATRTRCIEIRMVPKRPDERVEEFNQLDDVEFAVLRRKLARWAADNAAALKEAKPIIPAGLNNRAAANWKLLLAIAELASGPWPVRAREAAERLTRSRRRPSDGVRLLAAFKDMFAVGRTEMTSEDVVAELRKDPTSIWIEYNRGGPITQRQVAFLLDAYDIHPVPLHPTGRKDFARQGYKLEQFVDAFVRYLPVDPIIQSLLTKLKRQSPPTQPKRK
jgi:putative DNA primase/helicase